jgi:hypothetical protein
LIRRKFLSGFFIGGDGRGGSSEEEEEVVGTNKRKDKETTSPSWVKGKEKAVVREESSNNELGNPTLFNLNAKQKRNTNEGKTPILSLSITNTNFRSSR